MKKPPPRRTRKRKPNARTSIRALAESRGVSRSVVERLVDLGELSEKLFPLDRRGRRTVRDLDQAGAALDECLARPAKLGRPASAPAQLPDGVDFADPATWPKDAAGLKAVREHWGSIQAKQKAELTAGELVRADDVRRAVFDAMRVMRDQLLRIPDRTAEDMAAELGVEAVDVVRRVLTDGIERGLRDLAAALVANATPHADVSDAASAG